MTRYDVKLNAWASPCIVEATGPQAAMLLALEQFPTCDCCGEATKVETVTVRKAPVPYHQSVILQVRK